MTGLLIKDFRLLKVQKNFFTLIVFILLGMILFSEDNFFAVSFATFIFSLFSTSTVSYDEFDNGNPFLFSLPRDFVHQAYQRVEAAFSQQQLILAHGGQRRFRVGAHGQVIETYDADILGNSVAGLTALNHRRVRHLVMAADDRGYALFQQLGNVFLDAFGNIIGNTCQTGVGFQSVLFQGAEERPVRCPLRDRIHTSQMVFFHPHLHTHGSLPAQDTSADSINTQSESASAIT